MDRASDAEIDALLSAPGCPVIGPMDLGDWIVPVDELLEFARERGLAYTQEELRAAVDAYALARGGARVEAGPRFHGLGNVVRRVSGRPPVEAGEVWMFPMSRPV